MTLLARIAEVQTLWNMVLPHIPTPPPETVARWVIFPDAAVETALLRVATRFPKGRINLETFDATVAYRYTTATARRIADHRPLPKPAPATKEVSA